LVIQQLLALKQLPPSQVPIVLLVKLPLKSLLVVRLLATSLKLEELPLVEHAQRVVAA